ncbi:MAG: gliding motility protein, partial [Saprospiraceae bacterium]|nr:gliding motility protein [Saprospiraceae bacterium]
MKTYTRILLIAALFVGLGGCKTQKSRNDISPLAQFYQNTTAEFNGYYNANVLVNESMTALGGQYQDNFNQLLPIYKYRAADNPQAVAAQLDDAIKRVSVVVALHRVSHWTDDCYLLAGKAQYLKQDFETAEETLEYMVKEFSPSATSKKKAAVKKKKPVKKKDKKVKKKKKKKSKPSKKKKKK